MTLILTLACPWGIYQSSDYRLTTLRGQLATPEDDIAGAKQLFVSIGRFAIQLSFTGVAQIGTSKTRDWLSEVFAGAQEPVDIDQIASEIANRGHEAVKLQGSDRKMLTVSMAIAERGHRPRLIIISNVDRLDEPRLVVPSDHFKVSSLTSWRPRLLVLGYDVAVSRTDRRFLEGNFSPDSDAKSVMDRLSALNTRAARATASRGLISEGCMASALLADGRSFSINYGEVKGIPDSFVGQMNVGKLLRENLPGSATLKQSAGRSVGKAKDAPHLLPEGEPRHFQFSNPDALMTGIANVSGGAFDKLRIEGMNGTVSVRKNEPAKVVLAKVHFEAGPTGPAPRTVQEMPLFARFAIANPPTVDGVQPRNWSYGFDLAVDGELHTLQLRPLSTALRSVNLPQPLSILGPTEELTILAPLDWLILTARPNEGPTTGTIEGQFVLRDFPELGPPVTSRSVSVSFPSHTKAQSSPDAKVKTVTVGRNEKCPCGSGKKFKRCHGI